MFIVFEGIDGCGKSTQLRLLADRLHTEGVDVTVTREPFEGSAIGASLRDYIEGRDKRIYSNRALAYWFAAARADHNERVIKPLLETDTVILCDRYVMSSWVYQGIDTQSKDISEEVYSINSRFVNPFRTFLIKVDTTEALRRVNKRSGEKSIHNALYSEKMDKLDKEYMRLAGYDLHGCVVIDANGSKEQTHNLVYNAYMTAVEDCFEQTK